MKTGDWLGTDPMVDYVNIVIDHLPPEFHTPEVKERIFALAKEGKTMRQILKLVKLSASAGDSTPFHGEFK